MEFKILIVDDEVDILELMKISFERRNYDVLIAKDGKEALEVMRGQNVAVVLSDMVMPNMDGIELLKRIKRRYTDIDVIMMTGNSTLDSAIEAIKIGAYNYVEKPIDFKELFKTVDYLVKRKGLMERD